MRTVKTLYPAVNNRDNKKMLMSTTSHEPVNVTVNRRARLRELLGRFVQEQASQGVAPKGLEQAFASKLQISPSMLSQLKSSRPLGDKLARQIERACGVHAGWLDESERQDEPTAAEDAFVEVARLAWRASNAREKRELMRLLKDTASSV